MKTLDKSFDQISVKDKTGNGVFYLYLLFTISFFIHIPSRIPVLGMIRMDALLVLIITGLLLTQRNKVGLTEDSKKTIKYVWLIGVISIVTLPLVEWPGSVLRAGLLRFIKAAIFFFFTIKIINTEKQLKIFISVFVVTNLFRVIEPLWLNQTQGYWGSQTHLGGGEFAQRLAGSPYDVVNPNGLAFVISSIYPFLHYLLLGGEGKLKKLLYWVCLPVLLFAMVLTMSRTGILALGIIGLGIFLKSKRKALLVAFGLAGCMIVWGGLNDIQKERYLSITQDDVRGSETSQGRIDGVVRNFEIAMRRPIFGHGLGTSAEANANFGHRYQLAHNLYAEILQELGVVGLVLFLLFIKSVIKNFRSSAEIFKKQAGNKRYLIRLNNAMQVWLLMNILFSFASYGLSSYEWYLFGGLSVVTARLALASSKSEVNVNPSKWGK